MLLNSKYKSFLDIILHVLDSAFILNITHTIDLDYILVECSLDL